MLKKLVDYIRHRRFCRANGYFCPDCIYHEHIFDGIVFRGTRCLWTKGEKMTRNEAIQVLQLVKQREFLVERDSLTDAEKDAIDMAIEALEEVQKHEETWEWCHDCKEYDQEKHCCHRWSKRIWETIEELRLEHQSGEWIQHPPNDCAYECSNCGFVRDAYLLDTENYCPNCGADMRRRE